MSIKLQWGLSAPDGSPAAWGARAIAHSPDPRTGEMKCVLDIVQDRQDVFPFPTLEGPTETVTRNLMLHEALTRVLNGHLLQAMRADFDRFVHAGDELPYEERQGRRTWSVHGPDARYGLATPAMLQVDCRVAGGYAYLCVFVRPDDEGWRDAPWTHPTMPVPEPGDVIDITNLGDGKWLGIGKAVVLRRTVVPMLDSDGVECALQALPLDPPDWWKERNRNVPGVPNLTVTVRGAEVGPWLPVPAPNEAVGPSLPVPGPSGAPSEAPQDKVSSEAPELLAKSATMLDGYTWNHAADGVYRWFHESSGTIAKYAADNAEDQETLGELLKLAAGEKCLELGGGGYARTKLVHRDSQYVPFGTESALDRGPIPNLIPPPEPEVYVVGRRHDDKGFVLADRRYVCITTDATAETVERLLKLPYTKVTQLWSDYELHGHRCDIVWLAHCESFDAKFSDGDVTLPANWPGSPIPF